MNGQSSPIWLMVFGLFYVAVMLYWARVAARENGDHETYFSAGHSLSPWISALILAGASVSGWFVLGGSQMIATHGFGVPAVLTAGIALAVPGVLFFKRIWYVGQRLRLSSQAEIFRSYYESDFLVVVSTAIAILFAVGFAGLQMRALSQMMSLLTGGMVSPLGASFVLGVILFAGVVIGGMRAVGYFGVIQTVMAIQPRRCWQALRSSGAEVSPLSIADWPSWPQGPICWPVQHRRGHPFHLRIGPRRRPGRSGYRDGQSQPGFGLHGTSRPAPWP